MTNQDLDKMHYYLTRVMQPGTSANVKSEKSEECIKELIQNSGVNDVEFNSDFSQVRKADFSGYRKPDWFKTGKTPYNGAKDGEYNTID